MAAADPKPNPHGRAVPGTGRTAWAAIRNKLNRLLHNTENRELDRYRVEVAAIIETLDTVNRDVDGLRGRGLRGDTNRG